MRRLGFLIKICQPSVVVIGVGAVAFDIFVVIILHVYIFILNLIFKTFLPKNHLAWKKKQQQQNTWIKESSSSVGQVIIHVGRYTPLVFQEP